MSREQDSLGKLTAFRIDTSVISGNQAALPEKKWFAVSLAEEAFWSNVQTRFALRPLCLCVSFCDRQEARKGLNAADDRRPDK